MTHGGGWQTARVGRQSLTALLLLSVLFVSVVLYGETQNILYVDDDAPGGDGSSWEKAFTDLQAALTAAGSGFEIWVAEGTYKPHSTSGNVWDTFTLVNGVAVYGGFAGGETSITQRDWESNETILSGEGGDADDNADNCYHVVTGRGTDETAVLDGFTIRDGYARGGSGTGGGMYNVSGSPTVRNCTFSYNVAFSGGGMYNESGSHPTLINCTFYGNSAAGYGGGMFNSASDPTVTECTFDGNAATHGAGMSNFGSSPTIARCTFSGNSAYWGGGIWNQGGSDPTVTDCTFSGNSFSGYSASYGGGMYNQDSSPTVARCTFSGNIVNSNGGGMCNEDSSPSVAHCTFFGNTAYSSGGGMYNEASSPSVVHCTFIGNNASWRGAGMANTVGSNPTLKNTIIADNPSGDDCSCDGSSITSEGYNIDSDGSCITDGEDHDRTVSDPLLGSLADNDGPTETCALLFGSPALDAGAGDEAEDQRGVSRPQPAGGAWDIGAVEMRWFALTVTTEGTGTGTATSTPAGVDCGSGCTASYPEGTQVTVTAKPAPDSVFAAWSGAAGGSDPSVTVTLDDAKAVVAHFTFRPPFALGDVTGDSTIDLLDLVLCTQIARGIVAGTPQQRAAADVDGDGDVDEDDMAILSEVVIGTRSTLP